MNAARHAAAIAGFGVLSVVWTYPLVLHPDTRILGGGAGDNVAFLWNFWWMRFALLHDLDFFRTSYLFAPAGVDLTLHTHTALPAFAGATLLRKLPVAAALNATILASIVLSGLFTYLLAWRLSGSRAAAFTAGVLFAGSPFISGHLNGHFNLTNAWTVPLVAWAVIESGRRRSPVWPLLAGAAIGLTAYIDYYLLIYEIALCGALLFAMRCGCRVVRAPQTARGRRIVALAVAIAVVDAIVVLGIQITGGFAVSLFGYQLSARGTFNLLQVFWAAVLLAVLAHARPRLVISRKLPADTLPISVAAGLIGVVAVSLMWPLVGRGLALLARGDYVSQRYFWRSAPKGIDLSTVLIGNPYSQVWGGWTRRLYETLGLDTVDGSAWLGIVPLVLAGMAIRRHWSHEPVRAWSAIGIGFFLWALGPHLMVFGQNTGMVLPQAVFRYLPVVSNARIPGRAIVVVYLAVAVLGSLAIAKAASKRRSWLAAIATALIVLDYLPAPFPALTLDRSRTVYDVLRERPEEGAVCELPMGIRDGFGERGALDHRVLFYQTIHEKPLVAGFVARLSPNVVRLYERDPLLATFLRLSGDETIPVPPAVDRDVGRRRLNENRIAFVVLNRTSASADLTAFVRDVLPLTMIAEDAERTLYLVQ